MSALRLLDIYHYLLNMFPEFTEMSTSANYVPSACNFGTPFEIRIHECQEWDHRPELLQQAIVFCTDDSKNENGAGFGVFGPSLRCSQALGRAPSVFQVQGRLELYLCIRTYSQTALKVLDSFTIKSKLLLLTNQIAHYFCSLPSRSTTRHFLGN